MLIVEAMIDRGESILIFLDFLASCGANGMGGPNRNAAVAIVASKGANLAVRNFLVAAV